MTPTLAKPKNARSAAARLQRDADGLRAYALGLPGAWEDHPWGEPVAKVGKKLFALFGREGPALGLTVKLRDSHAEAMSLPFTKPTGYNLGKAGWISARFEPGEEPLVGLLRVWIRESYLLVAPRRVSAPVRAEADSGNAPRILQKR